MHNISTITPKKTPMPNPPILTAYNNIMSNVAPTTDYTQYISNYFNYIPYDVYMSYWLDYSINNPNITLSAYIYRTIYTFYIGQLFETTVKDYYSDSYLLLQDSKEEAEHIDHICKIDIELYNGSTVLGLQCKSQSFLNCKDTVKQYQIDMINNNYLTLYDAPTEAYIVVYNDSKPMTYNNSHLIPLSAVLSIHSSDLKQSTFNKLFIEINSLLS